MNHIIGSLGLLLTPIIVNGIIAFLRKPKKAKDGQVYLPKLLVIIGLIDCVLFLIPTIITAFSEEPLWVTIGFFAFSLLGATLIVAFINCRIAYDEEGFVAKNFFGIKRRFTYDEVTAIKKNMHESYLYLGRRRVMIDALSVGGFEFIGFVNKKYRSLHDGQPLPKIRKTKHDIFNGNVNDVAGFMFAFIMVSVIIVAMAAFLTWYVYFTPATPDNTAAAQVTFDSWAINDGRVILMSTDNQTYKIDFADEHLNSDEIKSVCDGETAVTVYSKKVTPDDGEEYFSIKAMLCDGEYILSFDDTNRLHRQEYWPLLLFPAAFAILWGGYIAGAIIVGRNPKKYSKKVIKLFFKDGYVNY